MLEIQEINKILLKLACEDKKDEIKSVINLLEK